MKTAVAWEIDSDGKPSRLSMAKVELEAHLEDWIDTDVTIIADDIVLIGRQVQTDDNTWLDLLGLNRDGDLVVIELKRDQTLRETVAQGIDYAEWCSRLQGSQMMEYGSTHYGSDQAFRDAFSQQLATPFPESLNARQGILIGAPEIPDHTARVINYLASTFGMQINGISFDVFNVDSKRIVVRHLAIDDAQAATAHQQKTAYKQPRRTLEEFMIAADEKGVRELFEHLLTMKDILPLGERFLTSY